VKTLFALILMVSTVAMADDQIKCVHQDAKTTYVGYGETLNEARTAATTECFNAQIEEYFQSRGRYPTDDEAAPILDICTNICPTAN